MKTYRLRLLFLLLALSSQLSALSLLHAATRTYDAEAAAVPQIDKITVAGVWAAADTGSIVIGNSTLTFTCGSDTTTTAQVASVIKNAINATSIDNNLVGKETRNAAGQLLGEFRDVEAYIDAADTAVVRVRSRVAGAPFGVPSAGAGPITAMTVSEVTAGSGTLTRAAVQAATGPWHWDNATNWSANTLPVNDDTAEFKETAHGPKYGLPNGSLEVIINTFKSFTGTIGLPLLNANGYSEYRQRYVRLDDAGTGTTILHRFGLDSDVGSGSPLVNLKHTLLACNVVVYGTGKPTGGDKALNICCIGGSQLTVLQGSVDSSSQDGGTSNWDEHRYGQKTSSASDVDVRYSGNDGNFTVAGGTVVLRGNVIDDLKCYGGRVRVENNTDSAVDEVAVENTGVIQWASAGTIVELQVRNGGTFDASIGQEAVVITNTNREGPSSLLDPYGRITFTNPQDVDGARYDQLKDDYGSSFLFKPAIDTSP